MTARTIAIFALFMLAGLTSALAVEFNSQYAMGFIQRDYFRHFSEIIIPFLDSGDWKLLFHNHHASPLLHLHEIGINYFGGGSLKSNTYIGVVLLGLTGLGLGILALRDLGDRSQSLLFSFAAAAIVILIVCTLTAATPVIVPLIYLQAYFLALGFLYAVITYSFGLNPETRLYFIGFLVSTVVVVTTHSSYGLLYFLAGTVALAVSYWRCRHRNILIAIAVTGLFVYLWKAHLLPATGHLNWYGTRAAMQYADRLGELHLIVAAYGKSLLAGFHGDAYAFNLENYHERPLMLMGFFTIGIVYGCITLWSITRTRRVQIAGITMLALLGAALAVVVTRGEKAFPYQLDTARYILMYKLAAASFIWGLVDLLLSMAIKRRKRSRNFHGAALTSFVCGLLAVTALLQYFAYRAVQNGTDSLRTGQAAREMALYMYGEDASNTFLPPSTVILGTKPDYYQPVVAWFQERQLNVFSPRYRGTEQLQNHKAAQQVFSHAGERATPVDMQNKYCFRHKGYSESQAWRVVIDSQQRADFALKYLDGDEKRLSYPIWPGHQTVYGVILPERPIRFCFSKKASMPSISIMPMH